MKRVDPLLSLIEAAALSGLDRETVRRAIRDGRLPAEYHGRALRLRYPDVEAWAASRVRPAVLRRRPSEAT